MSISSFVNKNLTTLVANFMRSIGRLTGIRGFNFFNIPVPDTYDASPSYVLYIKRM